MLVHLDETEEKLVDATDCIPAGLAPCDHFEHEVVIAGFGACTSCECRGYIPAKENYCKCGHHFRQHK